LQTGPGKETTLSVHEDLVAAGRAANTDILHPERSGVKTDAAGWIEVNEYLETSQPNIWAFGDAQLEASIQAQGQL
jgi:dihydrolipoamide dehydrogenase